MTALLDRLGVDLNATGVVAYSTTTALGSGTTQLHLGGMPETPDTVACLTTYPGGPEPDSRNAWEYPRVQVRVRAGDPLAALALDRALFDVLQFTPAGPGPRDIGGGWFLQDCYCLQSEAEPLGQDNQGRWEYARNYQLSAEHS